MKTKFAICMAVAIAGLMTAGQTFAQSSNQTTWHQTPGHSSHNEWDQSQWRAPQDHYQPPQHQYTPPQNWNTPPTHWQQPPTHWNQPPTHWTTNPPHQTTPPHWNYNPPRTPSCSYPHTPPPRTWQPPMGAPNEAFDPYRNTHGGHGGR